MKPDLPPYVVTALRQYSDFIGMCYSEAAQSDALSRIHALTEQGKADEIPADLWKAHAEEMHRAFLESVNRFNDAVMRDLRIVVVKGVPTDELDDTPDLFCPKFDEDEVPF